MDSSALTFDIHGKLLRALSDCAGVHFNGLQQAARVLGRDQRLSKDTVKKLSNLDTAWGVIRHITSVSCREFLKVVMDELEQRFESDVDVSKISKTGGTKKNELMEFQMARKDQRMMSLEKLFDNTSGMKLRAAFAEWQRLVMETKARAKIDAIQNKVAEMEAQAKAQVDAIQNKMAEMENLLKMKEKEKEKEEDEKKKRKLDNQDSKDEKDVETGKRQLDNQDSKDAKDVQMLNEIQASKTLAQGTGKKLNYSKWDHLGDSDDEFPLLSDASDTDSSPEDYHDAFSRFDLDDTVILTGLTSAAGRALNGKEGTIIGLSESGRLEIMLREDCKQVCIKSENCQRVP